MAIDEHSRHHLFRTLEEKMGPEAARTLMKLLPPEGWGDVVTKHDLSAEVEHLRLSLELRIERSLRALTMWLVGTMFAIATIALVIARVT